jgi:hypothetical protein|nr:MAG TPA: hypothetical protein [Caudoviricetes sp.]
MVTLRKLCYKLALAALLLGIVSLMGTALVALFMAVFMPAQVAHNAALGMAVASSFMLAITGGLLMLMPDFDSEL